MGWTHHHLFRSLLANLVAISYKHKTLNLQSWQILRLLRGNGLIRMAGCINFLPFRYFLSYGSWKKIRNKILPPILATNFGTKKFLLPHLWRMNSTGLGQWNNEALIVRRTRTKFTLFQYLIDLFAYVGSILSSSQFALLIQNLMLVMCQ